jgi:hypothetical protein
MEWASYEGPAGDAGDAEEGGQEEVYKYVKGDDADSDQEWVAQVKRQHTEKRAARKRRRRLREFAGNSASESESDSDGDGGGDGCGDSDFSSDEEAAGARARAGAGAACDAAEAEAAGAGAGADWAGDSFDDAVRRPVAARRAKKRGGGAVGGVTCWGCKHGITGGDECAQESLRGVVSFVSSYYGTMDDRAFALELSKYHRATIGQDAKRSGGKAQEWDPASIFVHFRDHTLHPRIREVQRLRCLKAVSNQLRSRVMRVNPHTMGEEVNRQVVEMLLKVTDRETAIYRAGAKQLFPTAEGVQ